MFVINRTKGPTKEDISEDEEEEWPPKYEQEELGSPAEPNEAPFVRVVAPATIGSHLGHRLNFNVNGTHFEAWSSNLTKHGSSWLGRLNNHSHCYNSALNVYEFQRNPAVFECILRYLATGELHRPQHVCRQEYLDELLYFGISPGLLSTCCRVVPRKNSKSKTRERSAAVRKRWQHCVRLVIAERRRTLANITLASLAPRETKWEMFKKRVNEITDGDGWPEKHPYYKLSRVLNLSFLICSMSFVLLSIGAFVIETLPENHTCTSCDPDPSNPNGTCTINTYDCDVQTFRTIEIICVSWFTMELILRFTCSPNRRGFFKDPLNIIDLVSILPFYATIGLSSKSANSIGIVRVLRLARVLRIFKLARQFKALQILGQAIVQSLKELSLLVFLLGLGIVIFASAVFYAEKDATDTKFTSIPDSFWWAIITMTTVGYGDYAPITLGGRIVGGLCAVTGLLVIALPVPIFVNNFTALYEAYQIEEAKNKEEERRRREEKAKKKMEQYRERRKSMSAKSSEMALSKVKSTNGHSYVIDDEEAILSSSMV